MLGDADRRGGLAATGMVQVGLARDHPGAPAGVSPRALHHQARPETSRQGGVVGPAPGADDLPARCAQPRPSSDVDEAELILEAPGGGHLGSLAADRDAGDAAHRSFEALRRLEGHYHQRPDPPAELDRGGVLDEVGGRPALDLRRGHVLGEAEDLDALIAQHVDCRTALDAHQHRLGQHRFQARGEPDVVGDDRGSTWSTTAGGERFAGPGGDVGERHRRSSTSARTSSQVTAG